MSLRKPCILAALAAVAACGDDGDRNPCASIETACTAIPVGATGAEIQTAFINAAPDSTIGFGAGTYTIDRDLSLTVPGVRLVGAGSGSGGTVLSFDDSNGAQGILITGDHSTVEHLAVENTPGDAIKWEGVDGVVVRDVRVEWTAGPLSTNGAYGLYPVQCRNVLIEDSSVRGASDAGIYVGQSDNIIVRRNTARENVAGIEIENSTRADVYENTATQNTGGLLVFSLPGLQVPNGHTTRVYRNQIIDNNTVNFAPAGNIVGLVPTGTGIALLAAHDVEIFDNDIANHDSIHIGIISYRTTERPFTDPNYDAFPDALYIHDNRLVGRAMAPTGDLGAFLIIGLGEAGINANTQGVPDIVWDGDTDAAEVDGNGDLTTEHSICIMNNSNGGATVDFANLRVPLRTDPVPTTDLAPHACARAPLPEVALP